MTFTIVLCPFFTMSAQNTMGKATYVSQKSINMQLDTTKYDKETRDKLAGFFQKQFVKEYDLYFNPNESIYKEVNTLKNSEPRKKRSYNNFSSEVFYKNNQTGIYTQKTDFLDKIFLIKDSIPKFNWTIKDDQKYIGRFSCFKATISVEKLVYEKDKGEFLKTVEVSAWFTSEIPMAAGPGIYGGLPGLILEVNDGEYTIICKEVTMGINEKNIKAPKGGKEVSEEEFNAIKMKKKKEGRERSMDFMRGVESNARGDNK